MKKLLTSTAIAASLVCTAAYSHTNSIGYVGDGNGGLNFWYGSWHDNTQFNEAEIKIIRPDGTSSIDAFNLLEQDSPAGLLSGVNFFTSDGTQLVPYDPNTPHPQGMPNESYTWQGINYQNLATGQYTFIYIPLGDQESNLPGSPTAEWMPMDEVIRSLTINLTQGDLDGDANQNGILDINEVASGTASGGPVGPTVVSQGSSQVVAYIATSNGIIQVVKRSQTDTTWDNMSDGTTQNTVSTVTELEDWIGQVDQVAKASGKVQSVHFKTGVIGMDGDTRHIGFAKTNDEGLTVGLGRSSNDTVSKTGISFEKNGVTGHAAIVEATYSYDRTIGDWSNSGSTKESGWEVGLMYEPNKDGWSPIVGGIMGKSTIEGWTEGGNAQSALTWDAINNDYTMGVLGGEYNSEKGSIGVKYYTNKELELSTSLENKINLSVRRDLNSGENKIGFGFVTKF